MRGAYNCSSTLCWNCAKATGGCSWSDMLKPVDGWVAEENAKDNMVTYAVMECPLFVQDACNNGLTRLPKE